MCGLINLPVHNFLHQTLFDLVTCIQITTNSSQKTNINAAMISAKYVMIIFYLLKQKRYGFTKIINNNLGRGYYYNIVGTINI